MNARLAAIYGTNMVDEADVEKLAAAEYAEQLAGGEDEETADVSELTEEDFEALAEEVLAAEEGEDEEEEGSEKLSSAELEADHAGRVMAHAYWDEVEKIAASKDMIAHPKKGGRPGRTESPRDISPGKRAKSMNYNGPNSLKARARRVGEKAKGLGGRVASHVRKHPKSYAGAAAGAAGLAGIAAGRMTKRSSALDTLAEQRAMEILAANGVELNKTAGAEDEYDALAQVVEARAMEMLQQAGYTFEE